VVGLNEVGEPLASPLGDVTASEPWSADGDNNLEFLFEENKLFEQKSF
jgi:hypothetical protein